METDMLTPTQADYERYMAMPDAPKEEHFKDFRAWQFAVSGFVAQKQFIDDGYGEVDSCPACGLGADQAQEKP